MLLCVLVLYVLLGLFPCAVLAQEKAGLAQEKIVSVEIEGNRRIETEVITEAIHTKPGDTYSLESVRDDIKSIFKLGFFDDVRAYTERTKGGVRLIYRVFEKPVLVDIRIKGNDKKDTKDIEEVIDLKEGRIVELAKVNSSLDAIRKLYAQDGYVGTEVDTDIEPRGEGTVSVTFNIKEGKKAFVKKVVFDGNRSIKRKELLKGIFTKTKWFLSIFTNRGLYNEEEIMRDSDRIRGIYLDHGYIDAKVTSPDIEYNKKLGGYVVTFRIEEGNKYHVGTLNITGDIIAPKEDLLMLLKLKSGEPFSSGLLSKDISALTTYYGDKGYAFANVEPKFAKDAKAKTLNITFQVEKGKQVHIRYIDIAGNTRTRDKVIRRRIPIEESELFNASKIQAIRPRIFRLGYFEDNIQVATQRVEDSDDLLDINVKVAEKPTGFFSVAGGFSSVETFIFSGSVQEANLFGYGKNLSLSVQLGGVTRLFLLNYMDPNFLDTDWTFELLGFSTQRRFRDFRRSSFGGSLTLGRRLWRALNGRFTYRFERNKVNRVDRVAALLITTNRRSVSSVAAGLVWDSRNNILDPSSGGLTRVGVENAFNFLGGNTEFTRYTLSSSRFFPLPFKSVLALSGEYGLIKLRNVGNDLVVSERFFQGGPNSLRGFKFRRVGPRVATDDGDFVIIGGTQELLLRSDLIFPISQQFGLKGAVFFDQGNVFNDNESLSINPSKLRKDYGIGIRWVSPFGPLRLDVGFPLGKRLPGESKFEIQFSAGNLQ